MSNEVNVRLDGGGLSFQKSTSLIKASQIIAFLSLEDAADLATPQGQLVAGDRKEGGFLPVRRPGSNPRQAILDSGAKTNPQKIVTLAAYLCDLKSQETFSPAEIRMEFNRAGERMPQNFNRDFKYTINPLSYIYEDHDEKGQFRLTETAREAIVAGFPAKTDTSARTSGTRGGRSGGRAKSTKSIRDEIGNLEISPIFDDLPNYWDLATKGHRILWILAFAEKNGFSSLTSSEVSHLAARLKDSIPANSFSALTLTLFKGGCLAKAGDGGARILKSGLDLLAGLKNAKQ